MATTILNLQILSGFEADSGGGRVYMDYTTTPLLVVGNTYHIHWDGLDYTCVAKTVDEIPALGNPGIFGGEDSGEPFLIGIVPGEWIGDESNILIIYSADSDATEHTVSITAAESAELVFTDLWMPFQYASMFDMYLWETYRNPDTYPDPTPFEMYPGETYRLVWDGVPYDCVAVSVNGGGIVGTGVGNFGLAGLGEDTGEPFVMGVFADGSDTACLTPVEGDSHSVILYRLIPSGNEIILKNYSGEPVTYENVDAVMFDTPDGGTQVYTRGELISGISVQLELKDGNQTVTTPEGMLARSATIIKPDTLVPENIRGGAIIAGVEGEFLGDAEELALSLSMADGDMVITPTGEGKVISQVTITKPETLIPENIVEGVEIGGVVGTNKGTGGSGDGTLDQRLNQTLISATGSATFIPTYAFYECKSLQEVSYPLVSSIGMSAFASCSALKTISFERCTSMAGYAFQYCTLLSSISMPALTATALSAFMRCTSLTSVELPACTYLTAATFSSCIRLSSVDLPVCTTIGSSAFYYCSALRNVSAPACKSVSAYAFAYCSSLTSIDLPECTNLGNMAFGYCSKLSSIEIPKCTTLGSSAFYYCSSLKTIDLPACTSMGSYAFAYCSRLTSVHFSNAVSVGAYAFYYCSSLQEVHLPVCTSLPNLTFGYCGSLLTVNAPKVTTMVSSTFYSCIKLRDVNMPKLTMIPSYGFRGCNLTGDIHFDALTTVGTYGFYNAAMSYISPTAFPVLTTLSSNAFIYCYAVSWAFLPEAKYIGSSAFYGLYKMSWASFPAASYIYSSAFFSCNRLMSLYLLGSSYATLQNSMVFSQTALNLSTYTGAFGSIFVRASMLAGYIARSYWSYYSSRFVGLTDEEIAALEETV